MTGVDITPPEALVNILPKLRRRARRLCDTPDAAEDLVQEAALRVWARLQAGEDIQDVEAYGMTALGNLARQRWRDRKPTSEISETTLTTPAAAPAHMVCRDIRDAISRLPAIQAEMMNLILIGEQSPAELARQTGLPIGTVNSRLARARASLRYEIGLEKNASVVTLLE